MGTKRQLADIKSSVSDSVLASARQKPAHEASESGDSSSFVGKGFEDAPVPIGVKERAKRQVRLLGWIVTLGLWKGSSRHGGLSVRDALLDWRAWLPPVLAVAVWITAIAWQGCSHRRVEPSFRAYAADTTGLSAPRKEGGVAASSPHPLPPIAFDVRVEGTITLARNGRYYVWWAKGDSIVITSAATLEDALSVLRNYFIGKRT